MCLMVISNATAIAFCPGQAGNNLEVTKVVSGRGVSLRIRPSVWFSLNRSAEQII